MQICDLGRMLSKSRDLLHLDLASIRLANDLPDERPSKRVGGVEPDGVRLNLKGGSELVDGARVRLELLGDLQRRNFGGLGAGRRREGLNDGK